MLYELIHGVDLESYNKRKRLVNLWLLKIFQDDHMGLSALVFQRCSC